MVVMVEIADSVNALVGMLGIEALGLVQKMVDGMEQVTPPSDDSVAAAPPTERAAGAAAVVTEIPQGVEIGAAAVGACAGAVFSTDVFSGVHNRDGKVVAPGELGAADWEELLNMAHDEVEKDRMRAKEGAARWSKLRGKGKNEDESYERGGGRGKTQRQRALLAAEDNAWMGYAKTHSTTEELRLKELEKAVESLQKAVVAYSDYEDTNGGGGRRRYRRRDFGGGDETGVCKAGHQRSEVLVGTLVGPDCRRVLGDFVGILEDIRAGMVAAGQSEEDADDFVELHSRVLAPLAVVSRMTRKVDKN